MRKDLPLCILALLLALSPIKAQAVVIPIGQLLSATAVIASSGTTSGAISSKGVSLVGCQMPAAFTGTAISFTVATTVGGTYQELDNSSGKISYTVAASKFIAINPVDFYGVQFFKIVSNATESGARSLVCSLKGI